MTSFVDRVILHASAGKGGDGCVSVHREKFKPLGGPDGADGGKGGSISLIADSAVTTLLDYHFQPHRAAGDGGDGAGDYRNGHQGENLVLPVPIGTVVKDARGKLIADLDEAGMELVIAEGGHGGLGNAALASSKPFKATWALARAIAGPEESIEVTRPPSARVPALRMPCRAAMVKPPV